MKNNDSTGDERGIIKINMSAEIIGEYECKENTFIIPALRPYKISEVSFIDLSQAEISAMCIIIRLSQHLTDTGFLRRYTEIKYPRKVKRKESSRRSWQNEQDVAVPPTSPRRRSLRGEPGDLSRRAETPRPIVKPEGSSTAFR